MLKSRRKYLRVMLSLVMKVTTPSLIGTFRAGDASSKASGASATKILTMPSNFGLVSHLTM
ncbi:MAG: hypothetical protein ACI30I_03340 [Parabacteroides sp.]